MKNIAEKYIQKIIETIENHKGASCPIQVSDLMKVVPLTDRQIRKVIRYVINERKYPIGSKSSPPAGYFLITCANDFVEAVSNLNPRSEKINQRASNLAEACRLNNIEIPDVKIDKEKLSSHIKVEINNSIVFINDD